MSTPFSAHRSTRHWRARNACALTPYGQTRSAASLLTYSTRMKLLLTRWIEGWTNGHRHAMKEAGSAGHLRELRRNPEPRNERPCRSQKMSAARTRRLQAPRIATSCVPPAEAGVQAFLSQWMLVPGSQASAKPPTLSTTHQCLTGDQDDASANSRPLSPTPAEARCKRPAFPACRTAHERQEGARCARPPCWRL